jgi:hypothetical protein
VDLEDLGGRVGTIFGKAAIYIISESCSVGAKWRLTHSHTVSIEVLTEQKLSTSAVKAFLAKLGVAGGVSYLIRHNLEGDKLCNDTLTNFEALDLWSNGSLNYLVSGLKT